MTAELISGSSEAQVQYTERRAAYVVIVVSELGPSQHGLH
jgi:hypothetical protein